MDQATFDAYVSANPPGTMSNNVAWGGKQPGVPASAQPAAQPNDYWSNFFMGGPSPVQMPQYDTTNQDQSRLEQQRVIQALQAQAAGDPNSQAQQQLRSAYGLAESQQSSLGSTMRGQSAGAAMRSIGQGQQDIARGLPGDQQMLQLQEQQAAQSMLAQMLQQQQQQDIAQAHGMAGAQNDASALQNAMNQFYATAGSNYDISRGQIGAERNRAGLGFDLEGAGLTNALLQQLSQSGAGALGTISNWSNRPNHGSHYDDSGDTTHG